jgi:hypothetical protein
MGVNNIAAGGKVAPALGLDFRALDQMCAFHVISRLFPTVTGKTDRVRWEWKSQPLN